MVFANASSRAVSHAFKPKSLDLEWLFAILVFCIAIGFRQEVGGDWGSYQIYLNTARYMTVSEALQRSDPGYWLINVYSAQLDMGIVGVNLFCGFVFSAAVVAFSLRLPKPWLAITAAIPYLVIVVGMGYARQSTALGFAMLGLVALSERKVKLFVFWIVLGSLFHKTAVLLIPIAALVSSKNRITTVVISLLALAIAYKVLVEEEVEAYLTTYVDTTIQSSGAFIRLAMNALPALIFLRYRRKLFVNQAERDLWTIVSWLSLAMFLAFFITSRSTALDRLALYFIPIQLFVASHLPYVIGGKGLKPSANVELAVVLFYAFVLLVWLNFATHATYWLPYRLAVTSFD